jgi:hypothetical protein
MLTIRVVDKEELFILSSLQQIAVHIAQNQSTAFIVSGWVRAKIFGIESFDFELVCFSQHIRAFSDEILTRFQQSTNPASPFAMCRLMKPWTQRVGTCPSYVFRLVSETKQKYKISLRTLQGDSLLVDASSRDFTINAIYFDIRFKTFIDCFDGMLHSEHRVLNPVQNPRNLFVSNISLVFRLLEFSVSYKLSISPDIKMFFARFNCLESFSAGNVAEVTNTLFSSGRKFFFKEEIGAMLRLCGELGLTGLFRFNYNQELPFQQLFAYVPDLIDTFDQSLIVNHKKLMDDKFTDSEIPHAFVMKGRLYMIAFLFYPVQPSYSLYFLLHFLYDSKKVPEHCERLIQALHGLLAKCSSEPPPALLLEEARNVQTQTVISLIEDHFFDKCSWAFVFVFEAFQKVMGYYPPYKHLDGQSNLTSGFVC